MYTVAEVHMIKKLALLSLGLAAALIAADAWTKQPADWTDKDVEQVLSDSPWGDRMAVETGQRGNVGNADDGKGPMQGNLTAPILVMWRTALPVRLALAKRGQPNSETEPNVSILLMQGFPGMFRADAADTAKLIADTVLKVKGKADIHPTEIQLQAAGGPGPAQAAPQQDAAAAPPAGGKGGARGGTISLPSGPGFGGGKGFGGGAPFNLLVVFPKTAGLTADDKEFELVTKVGKMNVRKKFKLKDMTYNGKIEM